MAQKVSVQLIDDIDGTEATQTVSFSLHNRAYEVDLNDAHAAELEDTLDKFIKAARRVGSGSTPRTTRARRSSGGGSNSDSAKVREWAKSQGIEVNERGRLPKSIVDQYEAATA